VASGLNALSIASAARDSAASMCILAVATTGNRLRSVAVSR
jgi:hypothetical protein